MAKKMLIVEIEEAKRDLERLVDRAARGEGFVIAKGGRALVRVGAVKKRLGFLAGEISVPDDFDRMGSAEIVDAMEK